MMIVILIIPVFFLSPDMLNEVFWQYFNETPIITWVGQLGLVFFMAALITITYGALRWLFFE